MSLKISKNNKGKRGKAKKEKQTKNRKTKKREKSNSKHKNGIEGHERKKIFLIQCEMFYEIYCQGVRKRRSLEVTLTMMIEITEVSPVIIIVLVYMKNHYILFCIENSFSNLDDLIEMQEQFRVHLKLMKG